MFWIIGWVVFGLLIGLIARGLIPGAQPLGWARTLLLGIAGSFLGGAIGYFFVGGSMVQSSGWIGSLVGATLLLILSMKRGRLIE
jgi:uncharacterized membrane protein YeaQ/YmgE (transglycosylase-associated protein family)